MIDVTKAPPSGGAFVILAYSIAVRSSVLETCTVCQGIRCSMEEAIEAFVQQR
jgi:hypothetical protein